MRINRKMLKALDSTLVEVVRVSEKQPYLPYVQALQEHVAPLLRDAYHGQDVSNQVTAAMKMIALAASMSNQGNELRDQLTKMFDADKAYWDRVLKAMRGGTA